MALKKVLLAFDGSEDSKKALRWLLDFAKQTPVEIVVVSAIELIFPGDYDFAVGVLAAAETLRKNTKDDLLNAAKVFSDNNLLVSTVILEGNPASEIIQYASKEQVDLIICGTRGMGGFESMLLGSVAHKLVTYSLVPVLVIK